MTLKTGMTVEAADAELERAQLRALLPLLESDIQSLMAGVQTRVFSAMRNGSYTPELGDSAWREQYAYHQLLRHYRTRAKLTTE